MNSIKEINYQELKKDVENIKKEIETITPNISYKHFRKIYYLSNAFYFIGLVTLPIKPIYIFPWLSLSLGIFSKWTMIGHHVCHGGYDKCVDSNFNRKIFGLKSFYRRIIDWFDWWIIEAWNIEHNNLHHYHLGEISDPDLVEENLSTLREIKLPFFIKRIMILPFMCFWKWLYYAPNTYKHYCLNMLRNKNIDQYNKIPKNIHNTSYTILDWFINYRPWMRGLFSNVIFPYFFMMFIFIPNLFIFLNYLFEYNFSLINIISNLILAEISTNIHSFIVIVTNHSGNDLYRFDTHVAPKSGEFYLRQIISSANYPAGNDFVDFLHGWLNYQIEHHIFPDMSMIQYRYAMPHIKQLCYKYSIPYIQENVFIRLSKTSDIMIGKTSMKKFHYKD